MFSGLCIPTSLQFRYTDVHEQQKELSNFQIHRRIAVDVRDVIHISPPYNAVDVRDVIHLHEITAVDVRDVLHISRDNKTTAVVCASVCPIFGVLSSSAWVGGAPSRQFSSRQKQKKHLVACCPDALQIARLFKQHPMSTGASCFFSA